MSLANSTKSRAASSKPLIIAGVAIAMCVALAFGLPAYIVFLATSVLIAMVSLLGLGIVTGTAGMISLAQLTFAGIGAWVAELLVLYTPLGTMFGSWSFVIIMVIGGLASAAVGFVVGLPALRLRGVNLAVLTLGVAAAANATFQKVTFPDGWGNNRMTRPFDLPFDPSGDRGYFIFVAIVVVVIALAIHLMQNSRWGASWKSVAFSERGTASVGQSVTSAKLTAFSVSSFIAGVSGVLLAGEVGKVNYVSFLPISSLSMYVLTIVVGSHLIDMALFGGILFVLVPEILKQFKIPLEWGNLVFAVLGIQALTTNSNLGQDIRNAIFRRRRKNQGAVENHLDEDVIEESVKIPEGNGNIILRVEGLGVAFGAVKALTDVSLTVEEGSILGLIGPNGAGKSTFVDALTGFLPQHTGEILLDGELLRGKAPNQIARLGLRRTYQQDRVPTTLTVGAYVRFVARRKITAEEVADVLEYFGCPDASVPLRMVDVGTRRLIEVAANVAAKPKLLLLDEPAAGLSHAEHIVFANRLKQVPEKYGVTILIIEHDLDLVRSVCSTVTVLNFGEVLASGKQNDVLNNPEVIKAYMGETEML
ncbi:branched-chain amino acid ABC transporter ATP-binding protein/permease [Aurantimicrobium minutum]|uniref:branched-chain amino acid ABC transporter ATP-binding protein/permease n=1 Tax=Aurantimicrobium minutum TaxID=708131 RepID=UPI002475CF7B|nr:ATP-binding cassette domain-containing protein [Aurantimicrobium minutum]MDH6536121.1 branched-chain amino acid transport system permease protein [Aurantimicrobium minutum]